MAVKTPLQNLVNLLLQYLTVTNPERFFSTTTNSVTKLNAAQF